MKKERTSKSKTVREQYGLTQQELADYLGVSKSYIGMYEQHRCALPADAAIKLSGMLVHHYSKAADISKAHAAAPDETWHPHYAKEIKRAIFKQHNKLAVAEKELETMQQTFAQSVHVVHYVAAQQHKTDLPEDDRQWHKKHGSRAELHKTKFAQPLLLLKQLEVESLQYYLKGAKKLLPHYEKEILEFYK